MADKVVIPAQGWTQFLIVPAELAMNGILGPFPVGSIIERIDVVITPVGSDVIKIMAVLGSSGTATTQGFQSGRSLIQRSPSTNLNVPVVRYQGIVAIPITTSIPVGIEVKSGTQYILVRAVSEAAGGGAFVSMHAVAVTADKKFRPIEPPKTEQVA